MRKASKALIRWNLEQLPAWEAGLAGLTVPGAERLIRAECAEVRRRIRAGDCTVFTQSLIRFINRTAEDCRAGRIGLITAHGPGAYTLHRV